MIVDNFDNLVDYFNLLKSKEDFYYVQIIQRKKDGHRKSERVIKNFYIYSKEDFLKKKDYIIELCNQHNARAYFWINPRNARKIALECVKSYADLVAQGDCTKGYKVWDKKCGANPAPGYDKSWIVDIDTKDDEYLLTIQKLIEQCRGGGVLDWIPTAQGYHLISRGFDLHHFKQLLKINRLEDIDVHKDNPTLLYYAKDCEKCSNTVWCVFNIYEDGSTELSSVHHSAEGAEWFRSQCWIAAQKFNPERDNKIVNITIEDWTIL